MVLERLPTKTLYFVELLDPVTRHFDMLRVLFSALQDVTSDVD